MDEMLERVLNARVTEVLPGPTPLGEAPGLSQRLGVPVWIKREDLTPVFSFKLRGAYNRIAHLSDAELGRGVIAASAGNHAQGVAYACRRRGAQCRIFADGVAVRQVGELTLRLCQRYVDEILLVTQDEICAAIQDAFLE